MKFKNMFPISALCVVFALGMISTAFAVEVGEKAPDFELASTQGGKLKLSSFQGKKNVLIEFYVLDFTPT
jgi:peroxiredoxin